MTHSRKSGMVHGDSDDQFGKRMGSVKHPFENAKKNLVKIKYQQ